MKNYDSSNEQDELKRLTNRCIAIILTELGLDDEVQADKPVISVIKNSIRKFEHNINKYILNKEQSHENQKKIIE